MTGTICSIRFSVIVLVCMVAARGLFLEYSDLIDPTESRYATVAQGMALSGDWLTPKLPTSEGVVAYLGKPPLHFWLTAFFYKVFVVEEWTSRLPSFLAALTTLLFVIHFSQASFGIEVGLLSALLLFSSGMFFFLAGASVTDMTLTACITGSIVSLYHFITGRNPSRGACVLASLSAGLAFLCKGPVALVLIALPFMLWSCIRKDFQWMRRLPWVLMGSLFLAVVLPWFIANQVRNPDFLRYFIWNENIARYLFREYGDRYGTGHVHTYGMSWLMLAAAFSPWSLVLLIGAYRYGIKKSWQWLKSDSTRLFCFAWGISAALFFTFVRQLNAMYLLPALPALSVLTALVCNSCVSSAASPSFSSVLRRVRTGSIYLFSVLSLGVLVAGAVLTFSIQALLLGLGTFGLGLMVIRSIKEVSQPLKAVTLFSSQIVCIYIMVIACLSPYFNLRRSAEPILQEIAHMGIHRVGVFSRNSYSFYWTSKAWENELENKVKVKYVDYADLSNTKFRYFLTKKDTVSLPLKLTEEFEVVATRGEWELHKRKHG